MMAQPGDPARLRNWRTGRFLSKWIKPMFQKGEVSRQTWKALTSTLAACQKSVPIRSLELLFAGLSWQSPPFRKPPLSLAADNAFMVVITLFGAGEFLRMVRLRLACARRLGHGQHETDLWLPQSRPSFLGVQRLVEQKRGQTHFSRA